VGCWHGYLSGARCRFAYGPADVTASHGLLLHEIQIGFSFTFLVWAHPGNPRQRAIKRVCVCVCARVCTCACAFAHVRVCVWFTVELCCVCERQDSAEQDSVTSSLPDDTISAIEKVVYSALCFHTYTALINKNDICHVTVIPEVVFWGPGAPLRDCDLLYSNILLYLCKCMNCFVLRHCQWYIVALDSVYLMCFDAVGWATGWASGL